MSGKENDHLKEETEKMVRRNIYDHESGDVISYQDFGSLSKEISQAIWDMRYMIARVVFLEWTSGIHPLSPGSGFVESVASKFISWAEQKEKETNG